MWLIIFAALILVLHYQWSRRKFLTAVANMDGPPMLPLIGHTHLLLKYNSSEAIYNLVSSFPSSYRRPAYLEFGPLMRMVFLTSPEHLQTVLNSQHCLSKSRQYDFLGVNLGLVTCSGDIWKGLRKHVAPSFGNVMVNSFAKIFNEKSSIFVQNLARHVDQGQIDIVHDIVKCFLDSTFATAFGVDMDLQRTPKGDEVAKIEEEFFELFTKRACRPIHYIDFMYRLSKDYQMFQEKIAVFRELAMKVVECKISREKSYNVLDPDLSAEDITNGKKPQIFLNQLLELAQKSEKFTMDDIVDNFMTIIVAGNETTATALKTVLLMLTIHPDIQERVYQEISQVCPEKDQSVSIEDVGNLSYTEMVCKESMRLYPDGPFIARKVSEDIKLDDTYTLAANSEVCMNILYLHRDPSIWGPDAGKFNPDRFLPENSTQRHAYAYLPFSAGPRNCLGMRYAWVSMKIFLVHLFRRYRLKTTLTMDDIKIKPSLMLHIVNGCSITVEERF